ncbi:flavin reductase family protein [Streptomyces sp. AgN23]|uniref:flavin reductase family protein n=1 Tax=Streptomyces sp. AgN23 TaxID=1188315 RepID=UPI001B32A748|nr:flavin reductase family protein [Streptomyces sp. AgN23]QTI87244.1 flavin reductase family protein [Streptomyces sp. AgN23]
MSFDAPIDPAVLRKAFACYPSGVAAVCAMIDDEPIGMAVSSFNAVSLAPPLISACIQDTSRTWRKLRQAPRVGVSIFTEEHSEQCRQLSLKEGDRFTGTTWRTSDLGAMFLADAVAAFDCSLYREAEAGDHSIALLEIHCLTYDPATAPLIFHRSSFRQLA